MFRPGIISQGQCIGFLAGVTASLVATQLPVAFQCLSRLVEKKRVSSRTPLHLDSTGWAQSGLELGDDQLRDAEVLSEFDSSQTKTLKIGSNMVLKLGPDLDLSEVDNMQFIRDHTTIPVSKIINVYEKNGIKHILSEFLEGDKLSKVWQDLPPPQKDSICADLAEYLRQMRSIPPPSNFIGSVTGGPAVDRRSLGAVKGGPFTSERAFNEWQLAQLRTELAPLHREMYAAMHRTDHEVVFSHGDLAFHNILVRNGRITGILDWEFAGWFPEHWDFCKSMQFLAATDEEYDLCKRVFGRTYLREYYMDMLFTRSVRHGGW